MTASLNEDLEKQLYHDLTQGREDIEDVTNDPNRQPQQDMVDFLQRGRRCHQELLCYTGRCMLVHLSDQSQTRWIWDMLQEKQAHTDP